MRGADHVVPIEVEITLRLRLRLLCTIEIEVIEITLHVIQLDNGVKCIGLLHRIEMHCNAMRC